MKNFFKVTTLGFLMVVLTAVSFSTAMAQKTPEELQADKTALYNKFLETYKVDTVAGQQSAIDVAKEYIATYNTELDKQLVDYFKGAIPELEKRIVELKKKAADEGDAKAREARFNNFNSSIVNGIAKAKTPENLDKFFAAGDEIIQNDKDSLDVAIVLAAVGSQIPKETSNAKYKALTEKYAKRSVSELEANKTGFLKNKTGELQYGALDWAYGSKDNTLAVMNIILGDVQAKNDNVDAAVPYYYKALQTENGKKRWDIYNIIALWYRGKAIKIGKERLALDFDVEENIALGKQKLAMEKGYADRAIDAFARAYKLASADKDVTAERKQAIYKDLKELVGFRYDQPTEVDRKTDKSINDYVAAVTRNPLPNPTTEVAPITVKEEAPTDSPDNKKMDDSMNSDPKKDSTMKKDDSMKKDSTMKKDDSMMKKETAPVKKDAKSTVKENGTTRNRKVNNTTPPKKN